MKTAAYTRTSILWSINRAPTSSPTRTRYKLVVARKEKTALTLLKTLYDNGDTTKNEDYGATVSGFAAGEGGVMINGTWLVNDYVEEAKNRALRSPTATRSCLSPSSIRLTPRSGPTDIAGDPQGQSDRRAAQVRLRVPQFLWDNDFHGRAPGSSPGQQKVIESGGIQGAAFRSDLAPLAKNGAALPAAVKHQFGVQTIEGEEVGAAMRGDKTIDAALGDADARINKLLLSK